MNRIIYTVIFSAVLLIIIYEYKKKKINIIWSDILYEKASKKIEEYLRKNETMTFPEAKKIISELKASVFRSRKAIIINDPIKYTNFILDSMVDKDKILYYEYGIYRIYKLKYK